jgi:hypothetical protein
MSIDIRLPNITATDEAGQLTQMRSYLYQFAEQLQWALNTLEKGTSAEGVELKNAVGEVVEMTEEAKAQDTFNSIKDLIIKSADIVNSYYDEINNLINLSGEYVASSEYGEYKQETNNRIDATDRYIQQNLYNKETIDDMVLENRGYIRYGTVGTTIGGGNDYATGIVVGDFTSLNENDHIMFARYTSAGVELFDGTTSTEPRVVISKYKITITSAEFNGYVKMGKYKLYLSRGIAFKWEEG